MDVVLSNECADNELQPSVEYIKTFLQFINFYFSEFPQYFSDVFLKKNME